ncbi:MAG TPA: hypothetical protein VHL59_05625 [Thermoanaerobaculia bacterium]|nr:hypothetical protein [Thermoanaerobaculia bacterium]
MAADARAARLFAAIGIVAAAAVFLPAQVAHVRHSADRFIFNDDARQWAVPFFGGAFDGDWTSRYYRSITPAGQRALYTLADAEAVSKILPYVALALTCWLAAATTFALTGSRTAAVITVCLLLSTAALMARMGGGSARAFGFPIVAAAMYALASGRMGIAAIATIAGAAFYPPAGVLAGVTLALSIFIRDAESWRPRRQLVLVAVTAAVSIGLLLPLVLSSRGYGRGITPADAGAYPEAGPHGRYAAGDRPPFPPLLTAAYRALDRGLTPGGTPLLPRRVHRGAVARAVVLALAGIGLLLLARSSRGARRLLLLPAASLLLYALAAWLSPRLYIPTRYVAYSLVLLPAIAIPAAAFALPRRRLSIALCVAIVLFLGGTGSSTAGLTVDARRDAALYDRLARMPELKLLAGWPAGPVDNVPYLSRKPALVTYETHAALHAGALDVMRARMLALIDAYFASSPEPLIRLRESFGVTHLLVDRRHFAGVPARYFAPFDRATAAAVRKLGDQQAVVLRQARHAAVFEYGPYVLLDLERLATAD